jgi:hypothetical protein
MHSDKILLEKYKAVLTRESNDTASLIAKVSDLIHAQSNNPMESNDLSTAFNALLLSLIGSTDTNVKQAAANILNGKPQVAKEEDEAISNPHGDYQGGNGF